MGQNDAATKTAGLGPCFPFTWVPFWGYPFVDNHSPQIGTSKQCAWPKVRPFRRFDSGVAGLEILCFQSHFVHSGDQKKVKPHLAQGASLLNTGKLVNPTQSQPRLNCVYQVYPKVRVLFFLNIYIYIYICFFRVAYGKYPKVITSPYFSFFFSGGLWQAGRPHPKEPTAETIRARVLVGHAFVAATLDLHLTRNSPKLDGIQPYQRIHGLPKEFHPNRVKAMHWDHRQTNKASCVFIEPRYLVTSESTRQKNSTHYSYCNISSGVPSFPD